MDCTVLARWIVWRLLELASNEGKQKAAPELVCRAHCSLVSGYYGMKFVNKTDRKGTSIRHAVVNKFNRGPVVPKDFDKLLRVLSCA